MFWNLKNKLLDFFTNKKELNCVFFSFFKEFDDLYDNKFYTNIKLIGNYQFLLSNKNDFFINNINKQIKNYNFEIMDELDVNNYEKDRKIFNMFFEDYKKELYSNKKKIITNFKYDKRFERGNLIKLNNFEYWEKKKWNFFIYLYENSNFLENVVKFKKNKIEINRNDIELWWLNLIKNIKKDEWFFVGLNVIDLNLYDFNIFLKEYFFYVFYSIYSLFFLNKDKFFEYNKSIAIDVNNLIINLRNDYDLRKQFLEFIKRDWLTQYFYWIEKWIPWSFDWTTYYFFVEFGHKLYNVFPYIKDVNEDQNNIYVDFWFKIFDTNYWVSHNFITKVLSYYLNDKSFLYDTITKNKTFDFINKEIKYFEYNNVNKINKIINLYNFLKNL